MNRLETEASPYLRQHAENPVEWYPWCDEAFAKAAQQDKPVLLSVGYASCHWCHVMAHESFEDESTAKIMNEAFINIKVDREERPDIDAIYMEATQAMTGHGGWPMTVFLTPQALPIFAGTYFPRDPVGDMPSFVNVLTAIDDAWRNQRDNVNSQAQQLRDAIIARTQVIPSKSDFDTTLIDQAQSTLLTSHDREWGGFGSAPKFPQTAALELLMQLGGSENLAIVTTSLDAMASGGIYDHLGGGFSRYSVDSFWMVPHFEKMLYDQAGLALNYLHAFQITGEQRFRQVAEETIGYVLRDLRSPGGALFASEDADSEGEEGRFYVWRLEEIEATLGDPELTREVASWYGLTPQGNFEGSNILHRPVRSDLIRPEKIEAARAKLFDARTRRSRPALDDKVLTEWNAMFLTTLAEAGAALDRPDWVAAASEIGEALLRNSRNDQGRWLRTPSGVNAYAHDYAWLVAAFTALSEATGVAKWRVEAVNVADAMIELFWDDADGGLFTSGNDAEQLIVRNKDLFDGATPSANSTAAVAMSRLALITDRLDFTRRAEEIVTLVADQMRHYPTAFSNMMIAARLLRTSTTETVIAGDHPELVAFAHRTYLPSNVILWGERDSTLLWEGRDDGAFVCSGSTCGPVAHTVGDLETQLLSIRR